MLKITSILLFITVFANPIFVKAGRLEPTGFKKVKATFAIEESGYVTAEEAVFAFYNASNNLYAATTHKEEVAGFVIATADGLYRYTNAVKVPDRFKLHASIRKPTGSKIEAFLHTHPGGLNRQNQFSVDDVKSIRRSNYDYYLRTPNGDVKRMANKKPRVNVPYSGKSVCPNKQPCLPKHPRS